MKRTYLIYLLLLLTQGYYTQVWAETKYVDLGLSSGTKWAVENEEREYTFYEAYDLYPNQLPTKEQFEELRRECTVIGDANGVRFIGGNGNSIHLSIGTYHQINLEEDSYRGFCIYFIEIKKKFYPTLEECHGYYFDLKHVRLVLHPDSSPLPKHPNAIVDLRLPSGTKWMARNIESTPIESAENIPLNCEWQELLQECNWEWTGQGYLVSRKDEDWKKLYFPAQTNIQPNNPSEFIYSHYRVNPYHSEISANAGADSLMARYVVADRHYIERMPLEYVDMGLPSGTKWASFCKDTLREISWMDAIEKYGMQVPTIEQFKELFEYCDTELDKNNHLIVIARNGNKIILNKEYLWTRTEKNDTPDEINCIMLYKDMVKYFHNGKKDKMSVHLVQ